MLIQNETAFFLCLFFFFFFTSHLRQNIAFSQHHRESIFYEIFLSNQKYTYVTIKGPKLLNWGLILLGQGQIARLDFFLHGQLHG